MKQRKEKSGVHFFDRRTGLHVLLDEISVPSEEMDVGPRSVSIAITNVCNLSCPFCYARLGRTHLPLEYVCELATALDQLGVLELTLGGGEPTLHPELAQICHFIWRNTRLGLSMTTHGHNLSDALLREIAPSISMIRFSVDGPEPRYKAIRSRPLEAVIERIRTARKWLRVGMNCVISPGLLTDTEEVLKLALREEINDVLLIPEHIAGVPKLSDSDWREVDALIAAYRGQLRICISSTADGYHSTPILETAAPGEFQFCHVTAEKMLQRHSYGGFGYSISDLTTLATQLTTLKHSLS